jgi:hypothetical protein
VQTIHKHGTFEEVVSRSSDSVEGIARRLRELIGEIYPDAFEAPSVKQRVVSYGVGPEKMSEQFCYIGVYKNHVNLGFYQGVDLPDPAGVLGGTGKKLRHVKLQRVEDVNKPAIRDLIEVSLKERNRATGKG